MHNRNEYSPQDVLELEKQELRTVLASKLFVRAPSQARLLSYVCGKYFDGEMDQIKEYTIAVELFKRTEDFQSKEDPIVRVEANRLRARLRDYYRTEGKDHSLQIQIPSGQYSPVFKLKRTGESPDVDADLDSSSDILLDHSDDNLTLPDEHNHDTANDGVLAISVPASRNQHRTLFIASLVIAGLALTVAATIWLSRMFYGRAASPGFSGAPAANSSVPIAKQPQGEEVRIMAGSNLPSYVDRSGRIWLGDRFFKGGEILTASPKSLLRAEESHLCRQAREGDFGYEIPLKPGIYELHLYFAEMQYGFEPEEGGETSRIFNVVANDRPILEWFDVLSDAAGGGKIDEKVFTDISPAQDGKLHLSFRSAKSKAIVNGIEILPGVAGQMRPVRITTRPSDYLSADQRLWESDRYFEGGRSVVRLLSVVAARDPELYQNERYGNFTYTIPVAKGRYRLTLKFAETYFGSSQPAHVGPKVREFDVYCNGQTLLKNFNIAVEAGGVNRSLDKEFHNLEPNAQGKLVLSFVPVKNYACVNAIEVVPE